MLQQLGEYDAADVLLQAYMQSNTAPPEIRARGHLAVEAYRNALREGSTHVRRVPIMLIGQEGSGKTSLKRSLMGQRFNPDEESTVGIDKDPSHFEVTTEVWKPGKKGEAENADTAVSFEYHAARLIVSNLRKDEKKEEKVEKWEDRLSSSTAQAHVHSNGKDSDSQSDSNSNRSIIKSPYQPSEAQAMRFSDAPKKEKSSPGDEPNLTGEVAALVEKLLVQANKEEEDGVYSVLWDFGGQSVYYVTHPVFLTPTAMYVLVHNLSRDPHQKDNPPVRHGVFQKYQQPFNLKTSLDYLDFWMTSVASLASPVEDHPAHGNPQSDELLEKRPHVFLVCTHADQPCGGKNARTLALEVYGFLQSKPYRSLLYDDVFVVDNTKSGRQSECSEVIRLREKILEVAKDLPQMKEAIPVKWLRYEKLLQAKKEGGCKCIPLHQAKEIATEECRIVDDQEFVTLLNLLHDHKTLIHFEDTPVLNNLVVLDLQWLVDVFKKVVTIKPYDYEERNVKELWCKLESTGILEETLLQHVWGPLLNQQETSESLIQIMEKFSLLCPWPSSEASSSKQYLVPSMLMSLPPQDVMDLVTSTKIPSLFLQFESSQVPPGLFPRLMLQFFEWSKDEFWSTVNPQLYQNFARFYTSRDDDCSVILLCHSSSIEVVVHRGNLYVEAEESAQSKLTISANAHHDAVETACARAVYRQLSLMLQCMRKEFCWMKTMRYKMGVICPVCCHGGVLKYCGDHHGQDCKQEECLHFWYESELRSANPFVICTKSATAKNNKVYVKQFEAWFPPQGEQASQQGGDECDRRLLLPDEQNKSTSLALPDKVVESLLSQSCDPKEVVLQLKENLQLDDAALKQPEPGTKRLIRYLAWKAKHSNKLDVVKHLREITPAGTTGPLLPGNLDIRNVPVRQMRELTWSLSGGDEWKDLAERLGFTAAEIRYLDKRTMNPCGEALAYSCQQCRIDVDDLYDVLNECGMPMLADTL